LLADTIKIGIAIALVLFATVGKVFLFSEWLEKHPIIKKIAESRTTYIVLLIVVIGLLAGVFQDINAVREVLNTHPPSPKVPSVMVQAPILPAPNEIASKSTNTKPPIQTNSAPNGFAISGGNVTNPMVNNAPLERFLTAEQKSALETLAAEIPSNVSVRVMSNGDPEPTKFGNQIMQALIILKKRVVLGWPVVPQADTPKGMYILTHELPDEWASKLGAVLKSRVMIDQTTTAGEITIFVGDAP
jgi:hypothetical protein